MKRVLYLLYYFKQLDFEKLERFQLYLKSKFGISAIKQWKDVIISSLRYNISILEYYQFRFFELGIEERKNWAGTGYMYEYQLQMNPKSERHILDDKTLFYKNYDEFFVHQVADLETLRNHKEVVQGLLSNQTGKIVLKVSDGKCGKGVLIGQTSDFTTEGLVEFMEKESYELAEEFLIQHPDLQELSPSAVNTVRIFTQLDEEDEVDILGCRLRISVNSPVDNMAAGNMAAPIDEKTGIVTGPGVYSDITKTDEAIHPVTGVRIESFQVPFWKETLKMVKKAALKHPQNRSIGWDVVITENGPGLIEGNHDWCKLLWQLPVKKGLKPILENYRKDI